MIVVEPGNPRDPDVLRLLQEGHAMMEALFPAGDERYLTPEAISSGDVHFFVARINGQVAATGALSVQEGYGEIRSLYVDEVVRRQGVADAMLRQLEDQARALNLPMLRLETGNTLNAALRLFARHGFEICEPFGDYTDNGTNLFMAKAMAEPNPRA